MSQNLKLLLVGVFCLLLGALGFFAYSTYLNTKAENAALKLQLESSPNPTGVSNNLNNPISPTPNTINNSQISENSDEEEVGTISGTTGYPSEGIPPLEIYAFNASDNSIYFKTTTGANQQSFKIEDVTPGSYLVVAYPVGGEGLTGGYTQAVPCGLNVSCTDHSLIEVEVKSGEIATGVEVKDWYAPEATFPKKP